jgi:glycosyltransferase involved in cell wall biosynthesis
MVPILFLAEFFPPPHHSGTLRSNAFFKHLPEFGIHPIVMTDSASQPETIGLGIDGDTIEDIGASNDINRTAWREIRKKTRIQWLLKTMGTRIPVINSIIRNMDRKKIFGRLSAKASDLIEKRKCKAIFATSGPPDALILAMRLGSKHNIPFIVDLRDPWSYQPSVPYRHIADFWIEKQIEKKVLFASSKIIVTANALAKLLIQEFGISREKIHVIENGYDEQDFEGIPAVRERNNIFSVAHTGQFASIRAVTGRGLKHRLKKMFGFDFDPLNADYSTRSLQMMLNVVEGLLKNHPNVLGKIKFVFAGCDSNAFSLLRSDYSIDLDCVQILPRVNAKEAALICAQSDLLLLPQNSTFLKGTPFCVAIAAKLYTYLRAGARILVSSQDGEMRERIERYQAGEHVPSGDIGQFINAIKCEFDRWQAGTEREFRLRECVELSRRERARELAKQIYTIL